MGTSWVSGGRPEVYRSLPAVRPSGRAGGPGYAAVLRRDLPPVDPVPVDRSADPADPVAPVSDPDGALGPEEAVADERSAAVRVPALPFTEVATVVRRRRDDELRRRPRWRVEVS
jgi:hypothetical protein